MIPLIFTLFTPMLSEQVQAAAGAIIAWTIAAVLGHVAQRHHEQRHNGRPLL